MDLNETVYERIFLGSNRGEPQKGQKYLLILSADVKNMRKGLRFYYKSKPVAMVESYKHYATLSALSALTNIVDLKYSAGVSLCEDIRLENYRLHCKYIAQLATVSTPVDTILSFKTYVEETCGLYLVKIIPNEIYCMSLLSDKALFVYGVCMPIMLLVSITLLISCVSKTWSLFWILMFLYALVMGLVAFVYYIMYTPACLRRMYLRANKRHERKNSIPERLY